MDDFKQQIRRKLIANLMIDCCARSKGLIFRDAWCTQERVIRFATPFFREFFDWKDCESGRWHTGDRVMYEAENGLDSLKVNCVLELPVVADAWRNKAEALIKASGAELRKGTSTVVLKSWCLTSSDEDANALLQRFEKLLTVEIPSFEKALQEKLQTNREPVLTEGALDVSVSQKYERNPKARAACIAAHGTRCAICGFDFGEFYGPAFAGMIEVHHIVPLSEIGEEYVVDPVRDLIPVCPNCHTALHSKPGGFYGIEELKTIRRQQSGK